MAEEQPAEELSEGGKLVDEGIRHYEAGQVGRAIWPERLSTLPGAAI
jgi:hypothetical protein